MSKKLHKEEYKLVVRNSKHKINHLVRIFNTLKLPLKVVKRKKIDLFEVHIEKRFDLMAIKNALNKIKISKNSCSIVVNLISNSDMDGLTLPQHIGELYKFVGGKLSLNLFLV